MTLHGLNRMAGVLALAGIAAVPNLALASFHASQCNPVLSSASQVDYNTFGVYNTSASSTATVYCDGGGAGSTRSGAQVSVVVYDRNAGFDVVCTVSLTGSDGANVFSPITRHSSGAQAAAQTLSFQFGNAPGIVSIQCDLPPSTPMGVSHVASYSVTNL